MENSTERFFKGFSLEDYRLQVLVNRLEKEKKQCLNRLREETHVFKMSIRPPVKCREDCWSQYGEIYHANGDKRELGSITQINMDRNKEEDVNGIDTASNQDNTISNLPCHSNRHSQISSALSPSCSGVNQIVERCQQRRRNRGIKPSKDSRKKTKQPDLTLLEILCADFENGTLLAKRTEGSGQSVSGLKKSFSNLDRESSKKAHRTDRESLLTGSDKSLKIAKHEGSNAQSYASKSSLEGHAGRTVENSNSDVSKSKSVSIEGHYSNSPHESSVSELCMSSEETVALQDKSTWDCSHWTSKDFNNNLELRKSGTSVQPADSQSHEGKCSKQLHLQRKSKEKLTERSASLDTVTRKNKKAILCGHPSLAESAMEAKTSPENSRFVHFKEKRKQSKTKDKKGNCVDRGKCKEKLNRTRSSGVKLFQVDGLQSSQQRKSQEDIDKETRQKMDQFFVKVEHTKTFQTSKPRWRCTSGIDSSAKRTERKTFHEQGKRLPGGKREHGYRRAQPWPTQVWS